MKEIQEEYLWSKTGAADPEIERLENALQAFRYDAASSAPPVLPAKVVPFRNQSVFSAFSSRRVFRLTLAFAACAAFVAVLSGVRYQIISNDNYPEIGAAETIVAAKDYAPLPAEELTIKESKKTVVNKSFYSAAKKLENQKQPNARKQIKARRSFTAIDFPRRKITRNAEPVKQIARLTTEEKYAYERLMLALSITSSKFKLVKDKVEGTEEKSAARENGQ
jgi:hypothetical protein